MQRKDLKNLKTNLRSYYKKLRLSISSEEKREADLKIRNRLFSLPDYKYADCIMTYVSKEIEVDTVGIIKKAFSDRKMVAIPKCLPNQRKINFYIIKSFDDLKMGTFGVLEPIEHKCELLEIYNSLLCIIPGLSFDFSGYRLGYGMGYYDRFLSDFSGIKLGICYSSCVREYLPRGHFDEPVDLLLTEKYILDLRGF